MQTLAQLKAGELTGTTQLKLCENLTELPAEILSLADTLEVLDVSGNQLCGLPDWLPELSKLKTLFASQNPFTELPEILGQCKTLSMLGFKSCQIKHIGENALPQNLRWLILTDNQIPALPSSIATLTRLQKFMLAGNQISALPAAMAGCKSLQLLRISANNLQQLPNWLFELPNLAWLAAAGNPCTQIKKSCDSQFTTIHPDDVDIGELLGQGASGVISRGHWRNQPAAISETDIAVKMFKGAVTSDGWPDDELHVSLNIGVHPNLVKILAQLHCGSVIGAQHGIVMSLIPPRFTNLGLPPTLDTCTRDTFTPDYQPTASEVEQILTQMADVVAHLHQRNICHGDIYAHNTLIDHNNSVLFSDFGAATDISTLPPEQQQGFIRIEQRALRYMQEDLLAVCKNTSEFTEVPPIV